VIEVLLDHHLDGYARLFAGAISVIGLEGMVSLRFITLADVALPGNSPDRVLWRFAQSHGMVILTGNRHEDDADSLGLTLEQEGTPASLPVLTIGRVGGLDQRAYRERCMLRLIEILLDLESYRSAGRIYIP
jgi:hypothetical protein